jgi:hypothetical protein
MFKDIKLFLIIPCLLVFACKLSNHVPLQIDFSADSTKIVLSNIDPSSLHQLANNLTTDTAYQKLVAVLQTPTDDDSTSMEIEWPGKLSLVGHQLIFTPDRAFVKGKSYLVETIINAQFASKKEVLKSEVGHVVKPQQKILTR